MVLIAGIVMVAATVPLSDGISVWALALERDFGWSAASLSLALILSRLVGLADPLVGYLTDRFGSRRMMLTGLCILAAGFVFFSLIPNLLGFYVAFLIMMVGQSLCGFIPLTVLISRWFVRRRATAIAISQILTSVGSVVLVPVLVFSVHTDYGLLGWRLTAVVLAGLMLIVAVPVFARLRNRPEDLGLLPQGAPPGAQQTSFSMAQTFRAPAFWLISFGAAFTSMAVLVIMLFLASLMKDKGFAVQDAGGVILAYAGAVIVFEPVSGYLGDRMSKRLLLGFFSALLTAGALVLVMADSLSMLFAFAVLFGAGFGGRGILAVVILPDYFGTASLGKILGFSTVLGNLLLLIGPLLAGWMYDQYGTYSLTLLILTGLSLLGTFFFLVARPPQPPCQGELQRGLGYY